MYELLAGIFVGISFSELLWNERWDLKMFSRYHVATWSLIIGVYLMIAASK